MGPDENMKRMYVKNNGQSHLCHGVCQRIMRVGGLGYVRAARAKEGRKSHF